MTVNVVLMHFRKKSLPVFSLEETTEGEEDAPSRDFGAEDMNLAGSIDRLQLQNAVEGLPPGQRAIFVLHAVEGYEHNEIATMMGCSLGNSKSQLHKARMRLREFLKMNRAEKGRKKLRKLARARWVSERYQTQFEACHRHENPPHAYCSCPQDAHEPSEDTRSR
jgi:RNA polymerase sigma-70 factor, ECF subfamily